MINSFNLINVEDFNIIKSPSKTGLLLIRMLVTDTSPGNIRKMEQMQQSVKMGAFH